MRTGWLPDVPDIRDYDAARLVKDRDDDKGPKAKAEPTEVDMRRYCSPVENQGRLGSCVAQAIVGMVEFMERRRSAKHVDASRLFVYKMARQLDGFKGDTGAHIRTGMKALRLFGAPPERYWPYDVERFDADPPGFVFAYGQSLQALSYHRVDSGNRDREQCLELIKLLVARRYPVVVGFSVYNYGNEKGEFPMPSAGQRRQGGHAVMVCGYDDKRVIGKTTGALMIRNSWGTRWGDNGYGWLPYGYILQRLSSDFWCLFHKETVQ